MTPAGTAGELSLSMQGKGVIHEGFQVIAPSLHVLEVLDTWDCRMVKGEVSRCSAFLALLPYSTGRMQQVC